MSVVAKSLIAIGSLGTLAGTGVAIYLNSGESIKDHIAKKKGSSFKFISLVSEAEESLKSRYKKGGENKPKAGDKVIDSGKIVEWCKGAASTKFSSETDPTYLSLKTWCFVDTTPLSEKAKKNSGIEYISDKEGTDDAWKSAWDAYSKGKATDNLGITDDSLENLNKNDKDAGALDLYKWCKKTGDIKEYEVDSEVIYKKYEKWCFKTKPGR